jgi:hypothetical protein
MSEVRLKELEEMAAKLFATARNLPPGTDREKALREIGEFRTQISALKSGGGLRHGRDTQPTNNVATFSE